MANSSHFKEKDSIGHVAETQARGIIERAELHGTEPPGYYSAASETARDTSLALLIITVILNDVLSLPHALELKILGLFLVGWAIWKAGRSAWLGWSRLERLHRIIAEEKWEIEHHRPQEREELRVLYSAKGFEGKLLENVIDVLMSDGDRLLKVMIEEEMGLSLEKQHHPLEQSFGALAGTIIAGSVSFIALYYFDYIGLIIGSLALVGISGAISAYQHKNRLIPAFIWNVGIGMLSFLSVYYLVQFIRV